MIWIGGEQMDPDDVEVIMNECCDEEDEDGCIPYESRFKIKILKRFNKKSSEFFIQSTLANYN